MVGCRNVKSTNTVQIVTMLLHDLDHSESRSNYLTEDTVQVLKTWSHSKHADETLKLIIEAETREEVK